MTEEQRREHKRQLKKASNARSYARHPEMHKARKRAWQEADPVAYMLNRTRQSAKKRGLDFNLTRADFPVLPTHCPVFGTQLSYSGPLQANTASLDREDSSKGYVSGNVAIMSWRANMLKSDAQLDELRQLMAYLEGRATTGQAKYREAPDDV